MNTKQAKRMAGAANSNWPCLRYSKYEVDTLTKNRMTSTTSMTGNMHYMEKTEYLYLPEEDISINKALKRLEAPCRSDCTMEIELLSYEDEIWLDILQQVFDQAGLEDANTLAGVLSRKDLDAHT